MATYNRAHFLEESLEYIFNQTFENFECIIVDDGSTDNTSELVRRLTGSDDRLKYFKRPKNYGKGLPGCRNFGLDLAQGEFIVFFDDDDITHPNILEWTLKACEASGAEYCRYLRGVFQGEFVVEFNYDDQFDTKPLEAGMVDKMICGEIPFNSCQVLWRKNCFSNIRFNEELMFAEEWECYTRILLQDVAGISLEKVLYFGRKHPNSNTGEFWNADPFRMESKLKAIMLVIDNLKKHHFLNEKLVKYFIRWGFLFNKPEIINYTLKKSGAGIFKSAKYKVGYLLYPFLKPLFNLKSKFKKA